MTVSTTIMARLKDHWAVSAVSPSDLHRAFQIAEIRLVRSAVGSQIAIDSVEAPNDASILDRVAVAFELAAVEGLGALLHSSTDDESKRLREQAQSAANCAFELRRAVRVAGSSEERVSQVLQLAALGYCGDRWSDLRRWLREHPEETQSPSVAEATWDRRVLFRVYDCWIRLLRKNRWDDLDGIREIVGGLRSDQATYEAGLFEAEVDSASQEHCLCREIVDQFREAFGMSPKVREHFTNSRIDFLKGIRAVIDNRIEHLSNTGQRGTKIAVE